MYECRAPVKWFLPPSHCSTKSKYIDNGKICCEQQRPHKLSAPVGIDTGQATHKKARVDPSHVGILGSKGQSDTGAHCENKADQIKPESSTIRVKTGTPEIFYFLQTNLSRCDAGSNSPKP